MLLLLPDSVQMFWQASKNQKSKSQNHQRISQTTSQTKGCQHIDRESMQSFKSQVILFSILCVDIQFKMQCVQDQEGVQVSKSARSQNCHQSRKRRHQHEKETNVSARLCSLSANARRTMALSFDFICFLPNKSFYFMNKSTLYFNRIPFFRFFKSL